MACGTRIRSQTANSLTTAAGEPARVVEYTINGSDEPLHRLLTTLVDPQRAPAVECAALYHERREIEGLMLTHYAVRSFLHEAAPEADEDPDRLSFTHAVNVVRRRIQNPGVSRSCAPPAGA